MASLTYDQAMALMAEGYEVEVASYGGEFRGHRMRVVPEKTCDTEPWKQFQMQHWVLGTWYLYRKGVNTLINSRFQTVQNESPDLNVPSVGFPVTTKMGERIEALEVEMNSLRDALDFFICG